MRTTSLIAAVLALGLTGATVGTAEARDGCGPGFHRNWHGFCRPNVWGGPVFYGYRRYGWGGGYRHFGWHRGWHGSWHGGGWHRFGGFHRAGFGGGHHFGGFHHRWR